MLFQSVMQDMVKCSGWKEFYTGYRKYSFKRNLNFHLNKKQNYLEVRAIKMHHLMIKKDKGQFLDYINVCNKFVLTFATILIQN